MRTVIKRMARVIGMAMASALFAALMVPMGASALTISGTVRLTGGVVPTHTVNVTLYENDGDGGWMWSTHFGEVEPLTGDWSIDVNDDAPAPGYIVAFDDQPYGWYGETAFPNAAVVYGDVSGGTPVAPGRDDINVTMPLLQDSLVGRVIDSNTKSGIPGITVTVFEETSPNEWYSTPFTTTTGEDGTYHLKGVAPGTYRIKYEDYNDGYVAVAPLTLRTVPGTVNLPDQSMAHKVDVERIAPSSGWPQSTQSVNVAKRQYRDPSTQLPDYSDVIHVVLASGDPAAQADPLAAAGLCWAYQVTDETSFNQFMNAPLLLVSAGRATDASVKNFIIDVARANPTERVQIHIVGGTGSVPDARFNEIYSAVVNSGALGPVKKRVTAVGNRYTLARDIAKEMKARTVADPSLEMADFALIANGADPAKFFDPLALSPIAASVGAPILLVSATSVPSPTYEALSVLKPRKVYIGGGSGTVSDKVLGLLKPRATAGSQRIWGADRYLNAIAIANFATADAQQWLYKDGSVAVASTIVDAQLGGVLAGNEAAPLLVNAPKALNTNVAVWLSGNRADLNRVYAVGSTTSISASTLGSIDRTVGNY